ncbi:unnamed protein product [Medioppia subpectinata]|uniref:SCP domain-containing protein n=1 Tax=Medioppia subpectinata TaxID=1979941 RepID=A0A7R9PYC5_9ACAR|nr:unnamed protein product [Medioppia subpectinata]CAG2105258.1 unnamed protein product [Medioppia subpectinata]
MIQFSSNRIVRAVMNTITIVFIAVLTQLISARTPLPDQTDNKFLEDCVEYHNKVRTHHNSPGIKINVDLVRKAKQRLTELTAFNKMDGMSQTKRDTSLGENIYHGTGLMTSGISNMFTRY